MDAASTGNGLGSPAAAEHSLSPEYDRAMVTAADDRGGLRKLTGVANGIAAEEGLESLDWNCECGGRMMDPGTGILLLPIRGIRDCVGSFDIFSSKLDPIRVVFVCVSMHTDLSAQQQQQQLNT